MIDAVLKQHSQSSLGRFAFGQVGDERAKPALLQGASEVIEDFEEEGILKVIRDQPDEFCALGC